MVYGSTDEGRGKVLHRLGDKYLIPTIIPSCAGVNVCLRK